MSLSIVVLSDIIVLILPPIVLMFHVECSIVGLNYLQIVKNSLEWMNFPSVILLSWWVYN